MKYYLTLQYKCSAHAPWREAVLLGSCSEGRTQAAGSKRRYLFGVGNGRKSHPISHMRAVISHWLIYVERLSGGRWEWVVLLCTSELWQWKTSCYFQFKSVNRQLIPACSHTMLAFDLVKETQKGQRCMRDSALVTPSSLFLSLTGGSWVRSGQQSESSL